MHPLEYDIRKAVKKEKDREDQAFLDEMLGLLKQQNEQKHRERVAKAQVELEKLIKDR